MSSLSLGKYSLAVSSSPLFNLISFVIKIYNIKRCHLCGFNTAISYLRYLCIIAVQMSNNMEDEEGYLSDGTPVKVRRLIQY
jgi:hypothetical protein